MKLTKRLIEEKELQENIGQGAYKAYLLAKAGYGPKAGNAMLEQPYGDPLLSRDGITNIRKYFDEDPVANMAIRSIVQASSQSNKTSGDGTTATVILVYFLYKEARKYIAAGYNRMEVAEELQKTAASVIDQLQVLAVDFDIKLLKKVAHISSGSEAVGDMLADLFGELGVEAHVITENFAGDNIYSEVISGFYFNKGFPNVALANDPSNLTSKHLDVPILISEKPLRTTSDIAPLLEKIMPKSRELIIIGEVGGEALDVIALNRINGIMTIMPVDPPFFEGNRSLFMSDLALVTGGQVYNSSPDSFNLDMLGFANKVIVDGTTTTIMGADGASEDVEIRIKELHAQLAEANNETDITAIKERLSRLSGKMGIIRVGAPTELEQSEVKLRIDDAICAIKAAPLYGVLPGGAVALARVDAGRFSSAYKELLKCLADNAGLNPEKVLDAIEKAKDWYGFDFNRRTERPINLLNVGIVDPAKVIMEVVKNATSIASRLITASVGLVLTDRDDKQG